MQVPLRSCLTLCDPMDCSLPVSVHGTLQARILEWMANFPTLLQGIFLTQGLNLCLLHLPALAGGFFAASATWEAQYMQSVMHYPLHSTAPPPPTTTTLWVQAVMISTLQMKEQRYRGIRYLVQDHLVCMQSWSCRQEASWTPEFALFTQISS